MNHRALCIYIFVFFIGAILGEYCRGRIDPISYFLGERSPAALGVPTEGLMGAPIEDWSDIPCVSPKQWAKYKAELNVKDFDFYTQIDPDTGKIFSRKVKEEDPLCNDRYLATRLSKSFYFADMYKIATPETWPDYIRNALWDLYGTLRNATSDFGYDPKQESNAYNHVQVNPIDALFGERDDVIRKSPIRVGSFMFKVGPFDVMKTLVHESRHSSSNDRSNLKDRAHVECTNTSAASFGVSGLCDEWLRFDKYGGAFGVGLAYYLGVIRWGKNVADRVRDRLKVQAIVMLSMHFNYLPGDLAMPYEVLYGLDTGGWVHSIHPFTRRAKPMIITGASNRIQRIAPRELVGVVGFGADGSAHFGNHLLPVGDTQIKKIPVKRPVDAAFIAYDSVPSDSFWGRGRISIDQSEGLKVKHYYAFSYLGHDGFIDTLSEDSDFRKFQPKLVAGVKPQRMIAGPNFSTFILDQSGFLFEAEPQESRFTPSRFQDPARLGWSNISSGVMRDVIYAVNKSGRAYVFRSLAENSSRQSAAVTEFFPNPGNSLLSVREGVNQIGVLEKSGRFLVSNYVQSTWRPIWPKMPSDRLDQQMVDFVWFSANKTSAKLNAAFLDPVNPFWRSQCKAILALREPWFELQFGVNAKNQLVFEDEPGACTTVDLSARFPQTKKFKITSVRVAHGRSDRDKENASPVLELTLANGERLLIAPYSL